MFHLSSKTKNFWDNQPFYPQLVIFSYKTSRHVVFDTLLKKDASLDGILFILGDE